MWAILLQILKEACKYNLHVFVALIMILGVVGYCLHKFLMSQQDVDNKFNFIGGKLHDIDKKVDGLVNTVESHSGKIITLENIVLSDKFKKEQIRGIDAG